MPVPTRGTVRLVPAAVAVSCRSYIARANGRKPTDDSPNPGLSPRPAPPPARPDPREPRTAPADPRARAVGRQPPAPRRRQGVLGRALPLLAALAPAPAPRQTVHRDRLAPQGLAPLLALEVPPRPGRTPRHPDRHHRPDPQDLPREPALGRPPHPRRAADARHQRERSDRGEVHDQARQAALAELADLHPQPSARHRRDRLPHHPDRDLRNPLRADLPLARPPEGHPLQRDRRPLRTSGQACNCSRPSPSTPPPASSSATATASTAPS